MELVYVLVLEAKFCEFESHRAHQFGELVQLEERLLCTQEVVGSIPTFSTNDVIVTQWLE